MIATEIEQLTYSEFLDWFSLQWECGQHVAIVGATGSGKTYVADDIKNMRQWVVVIATKSRDETLENYKGYIKRSSWPPEYGEQVILFWKKPKNLLDLKSTQSAIYGVMDHLYRYGGWTIYFDDLFFVSETLKLKGAIRVFYTQVRSSNVSIVASIQRPFWVPVEALSQSTYFLLFSTQDSDDIKRVAECIGLHYVDLLKLVQLLGPYEFLVIRRLKPPVLVHAKGA